MNTKVDVLDHGYVELVGSWGSDEDIISSARMSTGKGFQGWGIEECNEVQLLNHIDPNYKPCSKGTSQCITKHVGDEKLLRYLWTNKHTSPFEMAGLTIEVQAPIMVFREWHRHRTQSYNEFSARYAELPDLFYIPSIERLMAGKQAKTNKQSSEAGFDSIEALYIRDEIRLSCEASRYKYEQLLACGLSRELARLVIPVNQYSKMRASANLLNWLKFHTLRLNPGAQWEIRQYASVVAKFVEYGFPRTYALFAEELNA